MKKYELIVLTMHTLNGGDEALDIEDIAMKSEEISPGTFAWRKYKSNINLELVGFAVRDAKKEKYGAYVIGTHAQGWRLTSEGVRLGQELLSGGLQNIEVNPTRDNTIQARRISKESTRLLDSEAYLEWTTSEKSSTKALSQLLKINTYCSEELVKIKISRLAKLRGLSVEIDAFLDYLETQKGQFL